MSTLRTRAVILAAASLYVATLFLDWQRAGIDVAGVMHVHGGSLGWAGWGLVGGVCAVVLVALELAVRAGGSDQPVAAFALALGMVVATVAAIADGGVRMHAGAATVGVDATRWPAWVGLGLAVIAALAAAASLRADGEITTQDTAGPHGAT